MSSALDAARWLGALRADLDPLTDAAITAALDDLIRALQPVTPVVSGRMQAGYATAQAAGEWLLLNTAEQDGYPYPARVVDDPDWSSAYGALNQTLDTGADLLAETLQTAITRRVRRP